MGFNGFPRLLEDHPDLYNDRPEKLARIIHAEINAIRHAKEPVAGYTVYTWPMPPCDRCAAHLVSHEIARIVCPIPPPSQAARWCAELARSEAMYREAGMDFTAHPFHDDDLWENACPHQADPPPSS